jgi:transcriptional regulator with XRE-family HTH domain
MSNGTRSPNTTDVHIGKRLRILRLVKAMSQTDVADALGITFQQIQKYERGANRVGAGRLQEMANLMGVSPAYFFQDGPRLKLNSADPSLTDLLTNKDNLALMQAFDKIKSRAIRRHVVDFVERIARTH